jgi:hypothetical protein
MISSNNTMIVENYSFAYILSLHLLPINWTNHNQNHCRTKALGGIVGERTFIVYTIQNTGASTAQVSETL